MENKLKEFPERDLPSNAQPKKWATAPKGWLYNVGKTAQLWGHLNNKQKYFTRLEDQQEIEQRRAKFRERKEKRKRMNAEPAEFATEASIEAETAEDVSPPLQPLQPLNPTQIPMLQNPILAASQPENVTPSTASATSTRRSGLPVGSTTGSNRGTPKKNSAQVAKNLARELPKLATAVEWLISESNLGPNMPGAAIMLAVVDQSNRRSWKRGQPSKMY